MDAEKESIFSFFVVVVFLLVGNVYDIFFQIKDFVKLTVFASNLYFSKSASRMRKIMDLLPQE